MFVTFHHLASGSSLCARRRWPYNNLHTIASLSFGREQLDASNRSNLIEKPGREPTPQKGIGRKKITAPSVVENNKIRQHLDHIESTKHNLTLEDVERYKPHGILDLMLPTYDQKYQEIQNALTQSFTKLQLRRFLKLYGLPSPPSSKGKNVLAEMLMKQWGLETLAKVQEERAEWRENSELLYPMSPAYAFLFMDGADLLNLAKRYTLHLSFMSAPLRLRIQGLRGAVKQLGGYLKNFEDDITSETARMPHGLSVSLGAAQSISRFSGAYVEVSDDGKLLITYRKSDPASAIRVKRLAVQAASQQLDIFENTIYVLGESPGIVTKSMEDPEPCHSFYPFFSPQLSLSNFPPSRSAFRLRRVGQWLRAGARYNMDGEDISNASLDEEAVCRIRTRLFDELSTHHLPNSKMVVTATPGHMLFLAPSEQTLKPPIFGDVKPSVVLKWAKENPSQAFFNPSVPKDLMTSWPSMQSQFQRIVYKALPMKPDITPENSLRRTLLLEIPTQVSESPDSKVSNPSKPSQIICCQRSIETHADILLPSRAMDIRISVSHVEAIASSDIPKELQSFTQELDLLTEPVNPPLTLTVDGVTYILSSTSQIRRDHRHSSKSLKEIYYDFIIETTIHPEDGQQLMVCKVPCSNPSSDWHEFFTHCDHITMVDSKPSEPLLAMMKPWFQDSDISATQTGNEGSRQS